MKVDIAKVFLQVELSEVDWDATTFLWIKKLQEPMDAERNIECYRFCQMLFEASPSPLLLGATLKHHLDKQRMIGSQRTLRTPCTMTMQSTITVILDRSLLVQV